MKKIITIIFWSLVIISVFLLNGCSKKTGVITGNAIKLVAVQNGEQFSNSVTTTNEITFKCSLNYQIGVDKETSDFVFCLKDEEQNFKTLILSCDKKVKEADYYSYDDVLIYKNPKAENEFIKVDTEYCNQDCKYVIIYVEDNNELYFAKFIRK